MLTDYERYQLEWMIEHGHSLKEFVQGLDSVFDSLNDKYDPTVMDSIDNLPDAYKIWERDYGFHGEVFSNEREFKEEDLPAMNIGSHDETLRRMAADTGEMPANVVELIKSLYVVEGAMAQNHGIDYLLDNIEILTAGVRDMLSREAERGQWEGQYRSLIDKCEEMRADEKWDCRDTGTLVDGFAKAVEHEADAAFEVARIKGELSMYNAAYYNPETGDLIVSYLHDYENPTVEVYSAKTYELCKFTAQLTPDDIEYGETTHELAGRFARHVATYQTLDELVSAGYLDSENLLDVSSTEKLFKTGLAIATAEGSDIDLLVKRDIEEGRTVYSPECGIAIASHLDDAENPRIEVSHYTPYELTSLIDARMAPDASDIRDVLADPDRPRAFDHEVASFGSMTEFLASGWASPASISQKWLPMTGDRLEPSMAILDVKQTDNVREWYALAFPSDELAVGISPSLTFDDAIAAVPTGDGFYTALGDTADSLLRERIFEELCNRYGYTYDEIYDSWLHEKPLPSPAISQQPEKIAVAAGYRFNLVDSREASGIDLKDCGTVVTVDGHDYNVMKGATYEDSRKVDDLLDSHGDRSISAYRKQPQGVSLKQAAMESREASAKLSEKNRSAESPGGRDDR